MSLTVHLLNKNNEATLAYCLESIAPLEATILVGHFGTEDISSICNPYKAKIVQIPWTGDYSKARNDLVNSSTTDWQFYIEPWEVMQSGHEQLLWQLTQSGDVFNVYSVQGELLTKPTRLWKKSLARKFIRPVYESLDPDTDNPIVNCVLTGTPPDRNAETMEVLTEWKRQQPHAADIDYYIACTYLTSGRYDEFLTYAKTFLFKSTFASTATLLTHYYMGLVLLHVKRKPADCINHASYCLLQQPTMAEFWCMMGDAFIRLNQWQRATAFFDNAVIFGSRRLHDSLPIEITKYKEYPEKMLTKCRDVLVKIHGQDNTSSSLTTTVI